MREWNKLTWEQEIQRFLGLAGYYKRFVEGFLNIAVSLTELTKKGKRFIWCDKCEHSFRELKGKAYFRTDVSLSLWKG